MVGKVLKHTVHNRILIIVSGKLDFRKKFLNIERCMRLVFSFLIVPIFIIQWTNGG